MQVPYALPALPELSCAQHVAGKQAQLSLPCTLCAHQHVAPAERGGQRLRLDGRGLRVPRFGDGLRGGNAASHRNVCECWSMQPSGPLDAELAQRRLDSKHQYGMPGPTRLHAIEKHPVSNATALSCARPTCMSGASKPQCAKERTGRGASKPLTRTPSWRRYSATCQGVDGKFSYERWKYVEF